MLLKTAKVVAISVARALIGRIFFDECSQRGCNRSAFVSALNLIPTSYGTLSVCGFGASITEKSYRVTKIGLSIPTGVEYARVLVSHPPSSKLEFINDFSDFSFDVDIPLGADAVFRFLDTISDSHSEPLVQEPEFGHLLCSPLPKVVKIHQRL